MQKLSLSQINIDDKALRVVCRCLVHVHVQLRDLDLSGNYLHYQGTRILVDSLIENRSLKRLNLASNFMKDEGAECVAFYLGLKICLLEQLDLSDNFV